MIKCVCLVIERGDQVLLAQAHHRDKYYFVGGKIDHDENHTEALSREIQEELNLDIAPSELTYINTVVGAAYPQPNTLTELNCYRTTKEIQWDDVKPHGEITDLRWFDKSEATRIAPAVLQWIDETT
ncbi:NUDIX domain-containing protein [Staphylococcus sp. SQ8-PEA]|uniref:NUDIX domain-containing protein n=1 Tax=Staphylococcus marylandisciuri TaxID=2981529 RepID=A0ABT2QSM6_9STAP|nr:NUDIX domain-containing protein [Staphylococcus marylandisciuri]MCU5746991.1 NUDIX domain-containing protein [Staphylococcus marylandisciuri]